jgi:hypothetical protein
MDDNRINSEDPLYSRKVLEMITVANEYCLFLEKAEEYSREELFSFLQKITPLIYLKSALLPEIEPEDEDALEHIVTEEQWENMFNVLHIKFGSLDEFYFIDQQEKSHQDPVKASLAEAFTDTYQDLKDFLLLYQNPLRAFKENAVRECRRLFEQRYGYRIVNALTAIHCLRYPAEEAEII